MKLPLAILALAACLLAGCGGSDGGAEPEPVGISDLTPAPEDAVDDKGPALLDGCRSGVDYTEAWACVYGDPASSKTVVLWGDSKSMQYTPPMIRLAEERGWRLVTIFRGSCLTADVPFEAACDTWRENALDRIRDEQPQLIVTATDIGNGYALERNGERIGRKNSEPLLRRGYERTLRRLQRSTAGGDGKVVVMRDLPRDSSPPPDCLVRNPDDLASCDFKGFRKNPPGFDLVAARKVEGVQLVDNSDYVCPAGICNATRDGMVVYRDTTHLSATFVETMTDLIGSQIRIP